MIGNCLVYLIEPETLHVVEVVETPFHAAMYSATTDIISLLNAHRTMSLFLKAAAILLFRGEAKEILARRVALRIFRSTNICSRTP